MASDPSAYHGYARPPGGDWVLTCAGCDTATVLRLLSERDPDLALDWLVLPKGQFPPEAPKDKPVVYRDPTPEEVRAAYRAVPVAPLSEGHINAMVRDLVESSPVQLLAAIESAANCFAADLAHRQGKQWERIWEMVAGYANAAERRAILLEARIERLEAERDQARQAANAWCRGMLARNAMLKRRLHRMDWGDRRMLGAGEMMAGLREFAEAPVRGTGK